MDRRSFLKTTAVTAASVCGFGLDPSPARAANWAELPQGSDYWPTTLTRTNYKILEIHFSGGLSPYETFYVMSDKGTSGRWFNFETQVTGITWSGCGTAGPSPATQTDTFVNDGLGDVHLGPSTKPLWAFKSQMRVVVLRHNLEPHEAAIPFSLTGLPLGNPKFAGLGTAVEHRFDRGISGRAAPHSYVLIPTNLGIDDDSFQGFHATGVHGGQYRPLVLRIPVGGLARLQRTGMTSSNDLLRQYAAQYRDRLRHRASPTVPARSSEFTAYDGALRSVLDAPALHGVLTTAVEPVPSDTSCVDSAATPQNRPVAALKTAARLLALPEASGGAKYVGVVDGGIRPTTGGGYDVHGSGEYPRMYTNLWNSLSTLAGLLHRPAIGVTPDPNKVNLNDTLVVLNTEFGRTPAVGTSGGRDHFPEGYVNVLIGGPIPASGIAGQLDRNGFAVTNNCYTPTDLHAALLMAAGIDPFADENFGVGDVSGKVRQPTENASAREIRTQILGV